MAKVWAGKLVETHKNASEATHQFGERTCLMTSVTGTLTGVSIGCCDISIGLALLAASAYIVILDMWCVQSREPHPQNKNGFPFITASPTSISPGSTSTVVIVSDVKGLRPGYDHYDPAGCFMSFFHDDMTT